MLLSKTDRSDKLSEIDPLTIMLLERVNDAAFIVDSNGKFTYSNSSAHKLLKCSISDVLTMSISDLPLQDLSRVWSDIRIYPHSEKTVSFIDRYINLSADESSVEVTISYDPAIAEQKCCLLIRELESMLDPSELMTEPVLPNIPKLAPVFKFIEDNYTNSISLKDVATALGYCPSYLTDLVRKYSGNTVNYWIIKCRIRLACRLLLETDDSVNLIALATGYQNEGHFFRQFRKHCGMTPLAWRKSQQVGSL